ncbi:MAG: hypothetical protein IKQ69_08690 [Oscillospiraceae bacterium]|nr:hypothetical protein [Oscillospiraceae bacterium]
MKNRTVVWILVILFLAVLAFLGWEFFSQRQELEKFDEDLAAAETALRTTPVPADQAGEGQTPAEAAETPAPTPTAEPTATPEPTPTATPEATATPSPTPSPTPVPEYMTLWGNKNPDLKVTKDPTSVQVQAGGSATFTADAAKYVWCAWRFISPEGKEIIFDKANAQFPGITTTGGNGLTFTVNNIPANMDGWKIVCLFSDNFGNFVLSKEAAVKVSGTAPANPGTGAGTGAGAGTGGGGGAGTGGGGGGTVAPTPTPVPSTTAAPSTIEDETPVF